MLCESMWCLWYPSDPKPLDWQHNATYIATCVSSCFVLLPVLFSFVLQISGPIMTRSDFVRVQGPWLQMTVAQAGSENRCWIRKCVFNSGRMRCNVLNMLQKAEPLRHRHQASTSQFEPVSELWFYWFLIAAPLKIEGVAVGKRTNYLRACWGLEPLNHIWSRYCKGVEPHECHVKGIWGYDGSHGQTNVHTVILVGRPP